MDYVQLQLFCDNTYYIQFIVPSFCAQVLLGDVGAGKSSLVLRFVKGQFVEFQVCYVNQLVLAIEISESAFRLDRIYSF